jgi:hypothetical protein
MNFGFAIKKFNLFIESLLTNIYLPPGIAVLWLVDPRLWLIVGASGKIWLSMQRI